MRHLPVDDPEVARIIEQEKKRLENTLDLIAAENYPPQSILEAQGSVFSVKAAEGYPGNRFHAGCGFTDELESLAVSRAKILFGAEHANVQPHSGVSANLAVYFSVLQMGDPVLSMKLSHGGHLSHGDPASITHKCFTFHHYSVDPGSERIDYDQVARMAARVKPKMIVAGASSYSRLIDYEKIAEIAKDCHAMLLVDMAHIAGLVAAKVIPSPVPVSDFVTFTTYKTLMGGRGGVILCKDQYRSKLNRSIFPGAQGTTAVNVIAAKAVCFKLAMALKFIDIQKNILRNAACAAEAFIEKGYRLVSGGTDNHMVLLDLRSKDLTGKQAEDILESVGIVVNRNVIPYDPESTMTTSGLRLGFSVAAARGMGPSEVSQIVDLIDSTLTGPDRTEILEKVAGAVKALCKKFPYYSSESEAV
jgi:glycine hydroxymethyltransferase